MASLWLRSFVFKLKIEKLNKKLIKKFSLLENPLEKLTIFYASCLIGKKNFKWDGKINFALFQAWKISIILKF